MVSETRFGPLVHAQLAIGAENSGKLVSMVRKEARKIAERRASPWIIIDGPPGIACPVIASLTGTSIALIAIEPTQSGAHDVERVLQLTVHFGIPSMICVNKWEVNPRIAAQIEEKAKEGGASIAGRIHYDRSVTDAQIAGTTVVEYGGLAAEDIRRVWQNLVNMSMPANVRAVMQV